MQFVMGFALLFSEIFTELGFLLFGQVGLDDLELLTLDGISNFVYHRPARQKET